MIHEAVREVEGGCYINVEVSPNSKKVEFSYNEWRKAVVVRVKSPAKEGRANRELTSLFTKIFGHAEIVKGERAHSKVIFIKAEKGEVIEKIGQLIKQ
jgi:hypothetical protein